MHLIDWNRHKLDMPEGAHAFLGASQHAWINTDNLEDIIGRYNNSFAQSIGTITHSMAADCIRYHIKPKSSGKDMLIRDLCKGEIPRDAYDIDALYSNTKNYIDDAIGYRMRPEQGLYYNPVFFGTADAIAYDDKRSVIRIHDLKTGQRPASMDQLRIYAALFCLEFNVLPEKTTFILNIYQNSDVIFDDTDPKELRSMIKEICVKGKLYADELQKHRLEEIYAS